MQPLSQVPLLLTAKNETKRTGILKWRHIFRENWWNQRVRIRLLIRALKSSCFYVWPWVSCHFKLAVICVILLWVLSDFRIPLKLVGEVTVSASIFGKLWKWQLLKLCEWCHWQFMRVARITCEVTLSSWRWFFQNSPLVTAQEKCIDAVLYSIIWLVVKLQLDHIALLVHECPIMIHLHLHSMGLRAWLPYCIVCT